MTEEKKQPPYWWSRHRKDGKYALVRTKYPHMTMIVEDDQADEKEIADALKKAAEFVMKGDRASRMYPVVRCLVSRNGDLYAVDMYDEKAREGTVVVGEVCDEECDASCMHFCRGTCPYCYKRMADGEMAHVLEYRM